MIYLLCGSDIRRSREKLSEIIDEYRKKIGTDLSFYSFDAEDDAPEKIKGALETNSLFSSKKIVILKHLSLSLNKEPLLETIDSIKDSHEALVFLWERELDAKRLAELRPYCSKVQEFKVVQRPPAPSSSIFRLGDTFFTSPREGLRLLLGLLHQGHDDFNIFSYLANHARTLAIARHYLDRREPVPAEHGIHPYVVKKAENAARSLSGASLPRALKIFFEEDNRIKTGLSKPRESLIRMSLN